MATDYDKIREHNIREYGQGTRHLSFLGRLYTDRTHFIFELLQNAEDAGATRILFSLFDDRLEVTHDGRLFNERDVRGVCGVGEGTKTEDLTQIGKFGIGFKSVYAYTTTPEIHSGGEGFRIENYVRPYAVTPKTSGDSWTTLFVFPFNTAEIAPDIACKEIGARLRNLNARTLLFLRGINEIEFRLPNSNGAAYLREEMARGSARQVTVIGNNNGKDKEENWLTFERPVPIPGKSESVRVEVSFLLAPEIKVGKIAEHIVKITNSPLVVCFPTEKETRFGFLIHGPYRTTPSRDNIPIYDDWNKTLVNETAELLGDTLAEIKRLGLLSLSFIEALPIRIDDFTENSMFYPIVKTIRNKLNNEALLPADDGSFVSARNAKLARGADLRKLLTQVQLGQLFQSTATLKWLAEEITQDRTPELRSYLISELDVEEVTPEGLARKINHAFLSVQPDEWFIRFYGYLSGQEALWRSPRFERDSGGVLRSKPILRLANGSQESPFKQYGNTPNAFLPPHDETTFPVVSRSIVDDEQALTFLKRLGLSEPNSFDEIVERILPKYVKIDGGSVSEAENQADIQKIIHAICSESEDGKKKVIQAATRTPFLKAINSSGDVRFKSPAEIYIDKAELRRYFPTCHEVWFLHDEYSSLDIEINILHSLGVHYLPRKLLTSEGLPYGEREKSTRYETIENYDLDGLEQFLEVFQKFTDFEEKLLSASVLWGILKDYLELEAHFFKATYKWFYSRPLSKYFSSMILVRLKNAKWIPTKDGSFEKPSDVSTDRLLEDFLSETELIRNLGIVESTEQSEEERKREHATELGVTLEDIEFLKNHRSEVERLKFELAARKERPTFPTRSVAYPERRHERISEQLTDARDKKYEKRERSVRTTNGVIDPTAWLRNQYTNESDQMVCQICKEEMPFRKRNGAHYFEKKELLTKNFLPKEHEAQYLALCPLCAAKYEEFVKTDDEVMTELRKEIVGVGDYEISMSLGEEHATIRFVETHLHDLKVILDAME